MTRWSHAGKMARRAAGTNARKSRLNFARIVEVAERHLT